MRHYKRSAKEILENKTSEGRLLHYGMPRRSGRYPWGSGKDPYQGKDSFLQKYELLKSQGLSEAEIASKFKMNTTELRNNITWSRRNQREYLASQINKMFNEGMTRVAIAEKLGISEGSVRNYLSKEKGHSQLQWEGIEKAITQGVNRTGYLDVGVGVELQIDVSRSKFNSVVNYLVQEKGYHTHEIYVRRPNDPSKYTTVKVLTKEPDVKKVTLNSDKIRPLDSWSDDGGVTINNLRAPEMVDLKRVHIRYAEEGGKSKDGVIEIRPGVPDLDLGNSKYAQVRIGAGDNLYMKGMAIYSNDKFPEGKDIIYNVTKPKGTPVEQVLKRMKENTDNPFGANIIRQNGALNIINEEGDWDTWSTTMSTQFLAKQPLSLVKDRLDATAKSLKQEYDELVSLTNPIVKKHLLETFSDGLDAKARHLKAQGLPRTKNHVLLPTTELKPNEIYAPNYQDGERVVLIRHPHGGRFEIPDLVVNNKNKKARDMLGNAPDAVAIHPSVASKLSGADFDGDTALIIPNNKGQIKTSRSLKELKNFDPHVYQVSENSPVNIHEIDKTTGKLVNTGKTIKNRQMQTQMGIVSNLITDMTIKGASDSEIARAVKHSMVIIDSEKHRLDYKQSARDNRINELIKEYMTHINPDTGKTSRAASTLMSRHKSKVDISQHTTVLERHKKGESPEDIAKSLKISTKTVNSYIKDGAQFDPGKYSSKTAVEELYVSYIKEVQKLKNDTLKNISTIKNPTRSPEAAKVYAPEVKSLNEKLDKALLNKPKERQAQLLANKLFFENVIPGMSKDDRSKLSSRSIARARATTGAESQKIDITESEWEAIQARAISTTKLKQILENTNTDVLKKLAMPREIVMTPARVSRAQGLIDRGYTYAEAAQALGVSTAAIRDALK